MKNFTQRLLGGEARSLGMCMFRPATDAVPLSANGLVDGRALTAWFQASGINSAANETRYYEVRGTCDYAKNALARIR